MRYLFLFFYSSPLLATFVLNPLDPREFCDGIFCEKNRWVNFRVGYVTEYVYKAGCKQEYKREDEETEILTTNMLNYFGLFTLNICSRVDLYGFAGSMRMELDDQIFPKREPAWGVGIKALLFEKNCFALAIDGKYLFTQQKPTYFIVEQMLAPLVTKLGLDYTEEQLSLAIAYKTSLFTPYIGVTYFDCKVTPNSAMGIAALPNEDEEFQFEFKTFVSKKNWGLVLGASLFSCEKASFTIEARQFDQSSINGSVQIQF